MRLTGRALLHCEGGDEEADGGRPRDRGRGRCLAEAFHFRCPDVSSSRLPILLSSNLTLVGTSRDIHRR